MFYCWTTDDTTNNWSYCIQVTWLVVTEVRSESFGLVTERCHDNARHIYQSASYVRQVLFFIVECGIARLLCAMHIFDVRASSSPLRLPLWHAPHCWASLQRKITYIKSITQINQSRKSINHSISQSITHPAYLMCREPKLSLQNYLSFVSIVQNYQFNLNSKILPTQIGAGCC